MGQRVTPEVEALIREARQAYADSGDPIDAHILKLIEDAAAEQAAPKSRQRKRRKRQGRPSMVRLDANSPILAQVRNLGA